MEIQVVIVNIGNKNAKKFKNVNIDNFDRVLVEMQVY